MKQTTRITVVGIESQKRKSHGGLSVGRGKGRTMREKAQGIRTINGIYKTERGRLRIV